MTIEDEIIEPEDPEYKERMKELGLACPKRLENKNTKILHDYRMSISYNPKTKRETRTLKCRYCGEADYEETKYENR